MWHYDPDRLTDLYLNRRWSLQRIARYFHTGYKAVRNACLREGIPLRGTAEHLVGVPRSATTREKIRQSKLGERNPNHKSKLSPRKLAALRRQLDRIRPKQHSVETRKKNSETRIRLGLSSGDRNPMANPNLVRRWAEANRLTLNKQESKVQALLAELAPGCFQTNVNGRVVVGTRIPDFIDCVRHGIVELWGDYWHRGEDPRRLISYYRKLGYQSLIIWEYELAKLDKVRRRIQHFEKKLDEALW